MSRPSRRRIAGCRCSLRTCLFRSRRRWPLGSRPRGTRFPGRSGAGSMVNRLPGPAPVLAWRARLPNSSSPCSASTPPRDRPAVRTVSFGVAHLRITTTKPGRPSPPMPRWSTPPAPKQCGTRRWNLNSPAGRPGFTVISPAAICSSRTESWLLSSTSAHREWAIRPATWS